MSDIPWLRSSRRTSRRRAIFPSVAATALTILVPSSCNFGGAAGEDGLYCSATKNIAANSRSHSFRYSDLEDVTKDHVEASRTSMFIGTVIVPSLTSGVADVTIEDADYSNICGTGFFPQTGVIGLTRCGGLNSANRCSGFTVYLSRSFHHDYPGWGRHNACHEIGHTVGLAHRAEGDPSCLVSGGRGPQVLDGHDKGEINDFY